MTTKMQAHVAGEGGPPLVLVGGGLTGALSWEPFQARLAQTRRTARMQPLSVQYGLENRALPAGYSVDMESDALAAAIADLASEPVDLVGWSYGGHIALDFALDHPERVRTLTLIEPAAIWVLIASGGMDPDIERDLEKMRLLHERMRGDVSEDQLEEFLCDAGLCPPDVSPRDMPQWPVWVKHRRSLRIGSAEWDHRDTMERVRAYQGTVLLVTGRGTAPLLRRIVDLLGEQLPNGRVLELDGAHAPHIVEADRFLSELAELQR